MPSRPLTHLEHLERLVFLQSPVDLQILSQYVTQSNSEAITENLLFFPTLVGERFGRAFKIGATVSPN